jgi:integrase/recombinase XerD
MSSPDGTAGLIPRRRGGSSTPPGIERRVSPHFLRHAQASYALERGAKVTTVRDTLGYSSIATTDRYAHARPGESSGDVLAV